MAVTNTVLVDSSDYAVFDDFGFIFAFGKTTFDASYPTGGESVDYTSITGITTLSGVIGSGNGAGYYPAYDDANSKWMVFEAGADAAALDEAADTQDLTAVSPGSTAYKVFWVAYGV